MKTTLLLKRLHFLYTVISFSWAAQVGQVVFNGSIDEYQQLNQLDVPYNIVAIGDDLYMNSPDTTAGGTASTIHFLVDNSITMEESDPFANRFTVVRDLLDTITTNKNSFPDLEIGLSVYAQKLELKDTLPEVLLLIGTEYSNSGSYLPPRKLDSTYSGKLAPELLKEYLNTVQAAPRYSAATRDTVTVLDPVLLNQLNNSSVANNNIGFESVENAMNYSTALPENQYVILLTDGNGGVDGNKGDWRWREDIPTTFSIFFSPDGTAPLSLQEFTTSLQSSPYSASNSESALFAYENTSREALFNFIMNNIISKIVGDIITAPSSVTINGTVHDVIWNDSASIAELDGLTPLTGSSTDLSIEIQYVTTYDSTVSFDSTVTVYDTTYDTVALPVVIDPNSTVAGSQLIASYWDRSMEVRYSGVAVPTVTRAMDSIEISFSFDPLDAGYTYTSVSVDVSTLNGNSNEKESVVLTKVTGENRFSAMVPRTTTAGAAVQGDGIIQHSPLDTLKLFFTNSEPIALPLDTLTKTVPVYTYNDHAVSWSALFDSNADGYPDELKMEVSGSDAASLLSALETSLTVPSRYTLTPNTATVSGSVLTFPLTYTQSGYKTVVDGSDIVTIGDTLEFGTFGIFYPVTIAMTDSMAPVITSALYETVLGVDQLTVGFSEPVATVAHDTAFTFVSGSGNPDYTASVTQQSLNGATALFTVNALVGAALVENGDSIRIRTSGTATVEDTNGVEQRNELNRREPLALTREQKITALSIWDKSGDGYPDELEITVKGVRLDVLADSLDSLVTFPAFFTLNSAAATISGDIIRMPIIYDTAQGIRTFMNGETIVVADTVTYGDNSILLPTDGALAIEDKMAPVAISARYETVPNKELTVTFSEELDSITHTVPFTFTVYDGSQSYSATMTNTPVDAKTVTFAVQSFTGALGINEGDSLHIRESGTASVSDTLSNDQRNSANRRVPITVVRTLLSAALYDGNADGYPDTLTITASGGDVTALLDDIASIVTIPAYLTLESGGRTVGDQLILPVTYDLSQGIKTALNGETVTVADTVLYTHGVMVPSTMVIADSMAPVITSALVVDDTVLVPTGAEELMTVTFSEPVGSIGEKAPFTFISKDMNGREYTVYLSGVRHAADTMQFTVDSLAGAVFIGRGDSLYIKTSGIVTGVSDTNGIVQTNSANRRVLLETVRTHYLQGASVYDMNADGYPDEIRIRATGVRLDVLASFAVTAIPLPGHYTAEVGATVSTDVISVKVIYDVADGYRTYTDTTDSIVIDTITEFDTSRFVMPTELAIVDSMAPIVTSAVVVDDSAVTPDGVREQLTVTFSEDVVIPGDSLPFGWIATATNGNYTASLTLLSHQGDSAVFAVDSLSAGAVITHGDSLYISTTAGIADTNGVVQTNSGNHREPIDVFRTLYINQSALFDSNGDGYPDLLKILLSGVRTDLLTGNSDLLTLPDYISADTGVTSAGALLSLPVLYDSADGIKTTTGSELITVAADTTFATNVTLKAASVGVIDSMAPVVLSASMVDDSAVTPDGVTELLTVIFSETIDSIVDSVPFALLQGTTDYGAALTVNSFAGDTVRFAVDSLTGADYINSGDSLWIATQGVLKRVVDLNGVIQSNETNRRVEIAVEQTLYIKGASLFDRNADGYPDELVVQVSGIRLDLLSDLGELLPLPDYLTGDTGVTMTGSEVTLPVLYDSSLSYKTSLDSDSLAIDTITAVTSSARIQPFEVELADSMAPVVTFAEMVDSLYPGHIDLLRVAFSEPVDSIAITTPFTFVGTAGEYSATMNSTNVEGDTVSFVITAYSGADALIPGDSLYILWNDSFTLRDELGNVQSNSANRREEVILTTISEYVSVMEAVYYDGNGDGVVDTVKVKVEGTYADEVIDSLGVALLFPSEWGIAIDTLFWSPTDSAFVVAVNADLERTYVDENDSLILTDPLVVSQGVQLSPYAILPGDAMAPVIVTASLMDSVTTTKDDQLTVTFSEPVVGTFASIPFVAIAPDGTIKESEMTAVSVEGNRVVYIIPADSSVPNRERINGEDSLRIAITLPGVSDTVGNVQSVIENILREIEVQYEIDPYKLELLATLTMSAEDDKDVLETVASYTPELTVQRRDVIDDYVILSIVSNPRESFFDFDEIRATVTLFDVVGNTVVSNIPMSYDETSRALYAIWNTNSDNGRAVGRGAYLAIANLQFTRQEREPVDYVLKAVVGVQR